MSEYDCRRPWRYPPGGFGKLKTPPDLVGREVIFRVNGAEVRRALYDANSICPCRCGCVYDIIDAKDKPGLEDGPKSQTDIIYEHRNIRTGEWTECEQELKPMEIPKTRLFTLE